MTVLLLGKRPERTKVIPAPLLPSSSGDFFNKWLEFYRYSNGSTPLNQRRGDWVYIPTSTGITNKDMDEVTYMVQLPTNSSSVAFGPLDIGGSLYSKTGEQGFVVGVLSEISAESQWQVTRFLNNYGVLDATRQAAIAWKDCY